MKDVMMTGATGFVGRRLAEQLLEAGYDLTLLVRTPEKAASLADRGAELVEGDLTDPGSIREAMQGVDGVFHIAAIYRLGGDLERMRRVNVEGTRHVLDAAADEGVSRVLYCGSDTSLGDTEGEVCDETKRPPEGEFRSAYAQSKHEAHRLVEERAEEGAPVINAIVSTVYGPGDESPVAELIEHHLAGRAVAHLDGDAGYTFTHVDDVASGLRLAYERGEPGESYLISGEPATFDEFFDALSAQTGIPAPRFELPSWLVDASLPVVSRLAGLAGGSASEVREMVSMGRNVTRFFSSEKAEEELGWEWRSLEEGLRDTLPDFQAREATAANRLLSRARWPLAALAAFDLALGATAVVFPETYLDIMHPRFDELHPEGPTYLLTRTGVLWLVFSLVQGVAALEPEKRPGWVMAAGVLRLMDVPADPVYWAAADDLGWLGSLGLLSAPVFNFATGTFFLYTGYRALRARRWDLEPAGM